MRMLKTVFVFIFFMMLLCTACGNQTEEVALTPTGYPSEEIQRITVRYQGVCYWYTADGFDKSLADGFEKVGEVTKVNNQEYPQEDFAGTRLEVGQEIYANQRDLSQVYVKYEDGFGIFEKADSAIFSMEAEYPTAPNYQEDFESWRKYQDENTLSEEALAGVKKFAYWTGSQLLKNTDGNKNGNENYSPASLYFALSLAAMGAEGETLQEFQTLLGVSEQEVLAEQCGKLYRTLYMNRSRYGESNLIQSKIANSLWMKQGMVFEDAFIETAKNDFYSSLYIVDFEQESTAEQMSNWVKENTGGKIAPKMELTSGQILSIINTIYFYDEWSSRFDASKTEKAPFYRNDGEEQMCEFMDKEMSGVFYIGEKFTRAELGLKETGSMVFVLPTKESNVSDLLADEKCLRNALEGGEARSGIIHWQVPKFSYGSKYDLVENLKNLGLETAFGEEANFSAMTKEQVWINQVKQETHIGIDENGVEAAAYTEIAMAGAAAMPQDKIEMFLNRPFLYAIKARNGVPLFIGVYQGN